MVRATRKDFERFVLVIRALEKSRDKRVAWAQEIARILAEGNPKFNREIFMTAVLEGS